MLLRKFTLFLVLLIPIASLSSIAQNLDWAKRSDETGSGVMSQGYCVAVDKNGNVYSTGYFTGTVDFDPGAGVHNLTSVIEDGFIQKLDAAGNFVWAQKIGGRGNDIARSITVDTAGNVYVTGAFGDTVDFDPGAGVSNIIAKSSADPFVLKLDAAGNFVWAKAFLSSTYSSSFNSGQGVKVDNAGNVYVTGAFTNTMDFDPGAGSFTITSAPAAHGNCFLVKLDASGNFVWAKDMGVGHSTATFTYCGSGGWSLALDAVGNVYVGATFKDTIDADPGAGIFYHYSASASGMATFITKLDASGSFVWSKQFSGTLGDCYINSGSLGVDTAGNVFFTSSFDYTIDADPGAGVHNITSVSTGGYFNSFVEKLDASGNFVWVKTIDALVNAQAEALAVDGLGYVYSSGFFTSSVDFDPGAGTHFLTYTSSTFGYDMYMQKLDNNGNFVSAIQSDGSTSIQGATIAVDKKKNIYVGGIMAGSYDFDPGTGTYTLSTGTLDANYVVKFNQATTGTGSATACGSYVSGEHVYTMSGTYTDTLTSSIGSDSLLTLTLTINALPAVAAIAGTDSVCIGSTITLTNATSGGVWSASNAYATVSGGVVTGVTAGIDTIRYTVTNTTTGCSAKASLAVKVKSCSPNNIATATGQEINFHIAPNPNDGRFLFYISSSESRENMAVITNALGQKVKEFPVYTNIETPVSLDVASGVYFLSVTDGSSKFTTKILVTR